VIRDLSHSKPTLVFCRYASMLVLRKCAVDPSTARASTQYVCSSRKGTMETAAHLAQAAKTGGHFGSIYIRDGGQAERLNSAAMQIRDQKNKALQVRQECDHSRLMMPLQLSTSIAHAMVILSETVFTSDHRQEPCFIFVKASSLLLPRLYGQSCLASHCCCQTGSVQLHIACVAQAAVLVGVGFHHAAMESEDRVLLESLFMRQDLMVIPITFPITSWVTAKRRWVI
jgi:hypothetical protein